MRPARRLPVCAGTTWQAEETGVSSDTYQIYAVRYAHHHRTARDNFYGGDPHDGPMPPDYFVWAIVGESRTLIFDTGFDAAMAKKRGRDFLLASREGLLAIGVDPERVEDVVISHMHYDHAGNNDLFPNAIFHIQDREMAFCTGRCMCHRDIRRSFEVADVTAMVERVFRDRVRFHDGASEVAPGITVHHVGGHTNGLQILRVKTQRGWVVLTSDASHFYANFEQMRAYATVYNVGDMLEGFATVKRLATSPRHVIPGHDPLVLRRYKAPKPELEGIAARLDVEPAD
jgi:glyoxylase-like metal-dependent hydrolase (beta-lactamase superfamily II)